MKASFKEKLLELFFPSFCVGCNKIGYFLCPECESRIVKIKAQTCPDCGAINTRGKYCNRCRKEKSLIGIVSYGYFKDELLKELIHIYKYEKVAGLADLLTKLLSQTIKNEGIRFNIVFYVPLTRKREAWRGFNQSELMAARVAKEFEVDLGRLKKIKETKTQVGLTKKERTKNIKGVFKLVEPKNLAGKRVLLLDDVATTGATLNECARVLKKAGARAVYGAVLAKE